MREPGEYAVRGGIVDLYPSGSAAPLRLDFFGDEIENIRLFDALSQRTTGPAESLTIKPVSEVLLDETSITRFRIGAIASRFGTAVNDDPLYEAVSAGHRHIGVEHWLPLFYESLETIFDYLPGAAVSLDHQSDGVRGDRLESINDFYAARRGTGAVKGAVVYRPVRAEAAFPRRQGVVEPAPTTCARSCKLSPFGGGADAADGGAKPGMDFSAARADPSRNLFDIVQSQLKDEIAAGKRVLIAAYSAGSGERLGTLLKEHGAGETLLGALLGRFPPPAADRVPALRCWRSSAASVSRIRCSSPSRTCSASACQRPPRRRANYDQFVAEVATLQPGDVVVHAEHGIGRCDGLATLEVGGAPHDCLRVVYAGDDKLFVPVENIEVLSRYGTEDANVALDKLGAMSWQSRKSAASRSASRTSPTSFIGRGGAAPA